MNRRAILSFVTLLAYVACGGAGRANNKTTVYQDELSCGEAQFRLTTKCMEDPSTGDLEYISQSLWVTNNARAISTRVPIVLRLAQRPVVRGRRVLYDRITDPDYALSSARLRTC